MNKTIKNLRLQEAPEPMFVSAHTLSGWVASFQDDFPFTPAELNLLANILDRGFTLEPTCVRDLHKLRCLYWQIIGWLKAD